MWSICLPAARYLLNDCWRIVGLLWNGCGMIVECLLKGCGMVVEWLLNACWMLVEWLLNACWMVVEWLSNDCWMVVEWLLNDCWIMVKVASRHRVTTEDDFKLKPVLSFAANETRSRDWCNIITWSVSHSLSRYLTYPFWNVGIGHAHKNQHSSI